MSAALDAVRRINRSWLDWAIAVALGVDQVLESMLSHGVPPGGRVATAVFATMFVAPVAVRRRWPCAALLVSAGAALAQAPFHGRLFALPSGSSVLAPILLAYGVGAWAATRRGVIAVGAAGVLLFAAVVVETYVDGVSAADGWGGAVTAVAFLVTAPWLVGRFVRTRHRRSQAFTELEARMIAERTDREEAAVARERMEIGAELQDIIAHSVSAMVVQAGGARRLLRSDPDRARESIVAVERIGREALAEMRAVLGMLRMDDDPRALAPQPGVDQLSELVASLGAGGMACVLRTEGEPTALTPGIDLLAYRTVETALAGAAESGCTSAVTTLRYGARQLELQVRGDGSRTGLDGAMEGVRDRIALYSGRLDVAEVTRGEFVIRCRLPLDGALAA